MNKSEFDSLAEQNYTHVPISRKIFADFDTPLSVYLKLANKPYSYLLESAAQGGERWSRYSIIGLPVETVLQVDGNRLTVEKNGEIVQDITCDDPLGEIKKYQSQFKIPKNEALGRFYGGLVGYFGYDTVRLIEERLKHTCPPDSVYTPDILLMESKNIAVFDNVEGSLQLVVLANLNNPNAWEDAQTQLDSLERQLKIPLSDIPSSPVGKAISEDAFVSSYGREKYMHDVEIIRDYIHAGDVMQVVLAQRLSIDFAIPPIQLYRSLRSLNPSPYMYFMNLRDFHVVGSSPEILARVEDGTVINRPLAGTRRRGHTPIEDAALEMELQEDPKEIAEHLMLIDLGRNDVGRVSTIGSVQVTEMFAVEKYAHVMHLASNVEGKLQADKSAIDVLKATLPVGTLSGSPKIRAMEIIDELEPVKRGVYGGAIGYLGWNGNMDMAIAIRTAVIKDNQLFIETGAGIVADSVSELEWKECINKGRSIFQAAQLANRDLVLHG
ncbi:MAG: anthranilate synthase component I [Gammaproteobacteria bacterium]|nr:anthranilate synthase component I [Gammaproteobacteria bacterium]